MPQWLGWVFRLIPPRPGCPLLEFGLPNAECGFRIIRSLQLIPPPEFRIPKYFMKLIIAIIQPSKLEDVKAALSRVEVVRLTIMDVQGFGRQKGQTEVFRGREITVNLLRKVQLQIAVNDHFVEPTINAIIEGGRTGDEGQIGDGKIFVLPLEDCIRIRTGERGPEAI
jgi:nitrogen regulatory protein P-II 2